MLDALAVQPGAVPAARVDHEVAPILASDLGMSSRGIEVDFGIEVDVAVGHPANSHEVLFELKHASRVSARGLAKANHGKPQSVDGTNTTSVGCPGWMSTSSPTCVPSTSRASIR